MSISSPMQDVLLARRRVLFWMFWVEGDPTDLYAWSGTHTINYDGHDWVGVGHVAGMETIRKTDGISHVVQKLTLSGLDPTVLTSLDSNVRGRGAKIWLGGLNDSGQVVSSPILVQELVQETLNWSRSAGDTIKLELSCYEALPFVGRATGKKWSYEGQLEEYPGDTGFYYNAPIALTGVAVEWRQWAA